MLLSSEGMALSIRLFLDLAHEAQEFLAPDLYEAPAAFALEAEVCACAQDAPEVAAAWVALLHAHDVARFIALHGCTPFRQSYPFAFLFGCFSPAAHERGDDAGNA